MSAETPDAASRREEDGGEAHLCQQALIAFPVSVDRPELRHWNERPGAWLLPIRGQILMRAWSTMKPAGG
jgi:hypothetical protein